MNILSRTWQHLHDHFVPVAGNDYKPHLLHHRSLHLYAGFLVSVKLATLFSLDLIPENQAYSQAISINNIIQLTNASRTSYSLGTLQENTALDNAAQLKADDMLKNQYFAHTSPQGKTPWDWISAQKYNYIIAGENLAVNFSSAEGVEDAWMNSPGHRANILNKDFQDIGIGISQGMYQGVNAIFVVQMFGTKLEQPIKPQNEYTKVEPQTQLAPAAALRQTVTVREALAKLPTPVLAAPASYLINRKDIIVSGSAQNASFVTLLDNGQAIEMLPVNKGQFTGTLTLAEGDNAITAISSDKEIDSRESRAINVKLDTVAPDIVSTSVIPLQNNGMTVAYKVIAEVNGDPVKVTGSLGVEGVFLLPTDKPDTWSAVVPAGNIGNLSLSAFDMAGNSSVAQVASFAGSALSSYAFAASEKPSTISIFGRAVSTNAVHSIYLYFALGIITAMMFAIAIKRRIYHVSTFAHASAMAVLALFLWIT